VYNYIFFSRFNSAAKLGKFPIVLRVTKKRREETSSEYYPSARAHTRESRSLKSDNNDDNKTETSEKLRAFHHLSQYA